MKTYVMIVLAGLLFLPVSMSFSSNDVTPFVEMEVKGVNLDPVGQSPIVILVDKNAKRALPIWIGLLEATAIDRELKNTPSTRPMTHDLLHSILSQVQVKVKEIRIVDLRDNTYYASLFLVSHGKVFEVDARPSDSIVLALKTKSPILVSTKILDKQGILLEKTNDFGERQGIRIQELTSALASQFKFKGEKGVLVAEVLPGSAGEGSGLKPGDIIMKVNARGTANVQEFEEAFDAAPKGGPTTLSIFRDGKFLEVSLPKKR